MTDDEHVRPPDDDFAAGTEPFGTEPSDAPASGARAWWRPARYSVRARVIGVAVAVVVLAAGGTAIVLGARSTSDVPAPTPLAHDPVPAVRHKVIGTPARCGVSQRTLAALVPRYRTTNLADPDLPGCGWSVQGRSRRELRVRFRDVSPAAPPPVAAADAIVRFAATGDPGTKGARTVTGLGDEAMIVDMQDMGRTVVMRFENVIVAVSYHGLAHDESLSRKAETAGELRVATDIARRIGAPDRPRQVTASPKDEKPAISRSIAPCHLVPTKLVNTLLRPKSPPVTPDDDPAGITTDSAQKACRWRPMDDGPTRALTVSVQRFSGTAPGSGTRRARHTYLASYLKARATEPISRRDDRYFAALTGLGRQAFGSYVEESAPAQIVFRDRNVIVQVTYAASSPDATPTPINAGYAVATHIAGVLRHRS